MDSRADNAPEAVCASLSNEYFNGTNSTEKVFINEGLEVAFSSKPEIAYARVPPEAAPSRSLPEVADLKDTSTNSHEGKGSSSKRYLRLSKKRIWILLAITLVAVLAIILGVVGGLGLFNHDSSDTVSSTNPNPTSNSTSEPIPNSRSTSIPSSTASVTPLPTSGLMNGYSRLGLPIHLPQ